MRQATPPISVDSQRRPIGRSLRPAASGPAHGRPPTAMNFPRVLQDALLWCRPHHPYENPHQFQRHRPMCQRVRHLHGCTDPRPLDALQQFRHDRRNDQPGPRSHWTLRADAVARVLPLRQVGSRDAQAERMCGGSLLQPGVLRLCLHQNRNVGVGVFPEGEKIPVRTLCLDLVPRESECPT